MSGFAPSAATPRVGDQIPPVRHTADQPMIDAWSRLSGDVNPLHVDPEFAAATPFGGTIAHGHLSLTWLCEALLAWRGEEWLGGGALDRIRFVGPVKPGVEVRVEGEVTAVAAESATCEVRLVVDATDEVCVVGKATIPLGGAR
jgi:3-hydroxybutyryl-CoA dehydratase